MWLLPNVLTVLRLAAAPVLIVALQDRRFEFALIVFVIAGLSDGLDGFIAKRFNWVSRLGAILDPVADKTLLVSVYVMFALLDLIPLWLLVAVVFRDLLIVGGYLVLVTLHGSVQMAPSRLSKLNTVVQIALAVCVLAGEAGWLNIPYTRDALVLAAFATTLASGAHYLWVWGFRKEIEAAKTTRGAER